MTSYYENPHISLSGTLAFLQSASSVEVEAASGISPAHESLDNLDYIDLSFAEDNLIDRKPKGPQGSTTEETHQAYEAFLTDFEKSPSIEGSFAICWQPLSFLARLSYGTKSSEEASVAIKHQRAYLCQLSEIVRRMRPSVEPDGYVSDKDAAIFIHLSMGLILLSEQVYGGQSEQQWEYIDDALRTFMMPETESVVPIYEQTKFPRTIALSYEIAKALLLSKSASRSFNQHKYEYALSHYSTALLGIWIANNDIFHWWSDGDELPDEKRHTEFVIENAFEDGLLENEEGEPLSGGPDLWRMFRGAVEFENAVKAFDALIDEDSRDTDWAQLANCCWFFARNWHLLSIPIKSKHIPEQETVGESWAIAHGIVLNKMSNDDRIKELRRSRDYQIEDRLRLYFFGDTWDRLPDKARAALISADREYENTRGRRQGIFEDLWLAAREILVEALLEPYNAFCIAQKEQREVKSFAALAPVPSEDEDLYDTVQALYYAPLFEEYLRQTFNEDDKAFIKELEKPFGKLNGLRNDAVHANRPAYKRNRFERDIRETYAEFLGIGRNGILPRLMRLHPVASSKQSARR